MPEQLQDRLALITGGASGIGRATALTFAREGANVVIADVDAAGSTETVQRIKEQGGEALGIQVDVTQEAEVAAMVHQTIAVYGRLDCAFNNAGIYGSHASLVEYTETDWDQVLSINLKGVWFCMKYEIPPMLTHGKGAIVNTSSIAGLVGGQNPAYNASKHGVLGLTKTAALQYAKAGIRVNAVCPGAIRTPMFDRLVAGNPQREERFIAREPIGRIGAPEEIAEAVVWLCSDAASFVTGHALAVDGGWVAQ
jgi:NAD(P)-dependent dehydrogenase (short-subunit alcohol dehydrogenase family)